MGLGDGFGAFMGGLQRGKQLTDRGSSKGLPASGMPIDIQTGSATGIGGGFGSFMNGLQSGNSMKDTAQAGDGQALPTGEGKQAFTGSFGNSTSGTQTEKPWGALTSLLDQVGSEALGAVNTVKDGAVNLTRKLF